MAEYSQGVCQDGAAILKDGEPMAIEEILDQLREREALERQMRAVQEVRNRIGDSPMNTAGSTAVHLLERVLRGQAL